jgi:hypothetical protein
MEIIPVYQKQPLVAIRPFQVRLGVIWLEIILVYQRQPLVAIRPLTSIIYGHITPSLT